jgi:DNA-binding winged helix-turn-helix (wHTH) protein/tetratricopeptide (TPR) repeat protein
MSAKVYRFGPFRLDVGRRIVEQDGGLLPLPPKAVEILIVLVQNAGTLIDKETLFRTVWPHTYVVESSLSKNVCLLRRALNQAGGEGRWIETVSKRGYRFVARVEEETAPLPSVPAAPPAFTGPPARRPIRVWRLGVAAGLLLASVVVFARWHRSSADPAASEAGRHYLIGQYMWSKLERSQLPGALEHFQKAVELDPQSALANAGIAATHAFMSVLAMGNPAANLALARDAALRAIRLDPRLALPHVSLGLVHVLADFDARSAEREFQRAIQLEPDSAYAHYGYACMLSQAGRLAEARARIRRARGLDPVSPVVALAAARIEYYDHRYQHAIDLLRDVLAREPSFSQGHYYMAMALGELGRVEEARRHLRRADLNPGLLTVDDAWLRAVAGDREPARRLLAERREKVISLHARPTVLILAAVAAGDNDLALWALREMAKTREIELVSIRVNPRLDPLRPDARFASVVEQVWPGR